MHAENSLDERSWTDLDLDSLQEAIAENPHQPCRSLPGLQTLESILRQVPADPAIGAERLAFCDRLGADPELHGAMNRWLAKLGKPRFNTILKVLDQPPRAVDDRLRFLFLALGFGGIASIALPFILGGMGFLLITLPLMALNMWLHYHYKGQVEYFGEAFYYLNRLIATGRHLASLPRTGKRLERLAVLEKLCVELQPVYKRARLFSPPKWFSGDMVDVVGEYFKIISLTEVNAYFFVNNHIASHVGGLRQLFTLIGEIDSLQAVTGWRCGLPRWCRAEPAGAALLEASDLYHPLVEGAVANSIAIDRRGTIFSGTNMSGKSTFLRTIAVNQVLAQGLGLACASRFAASPRLVASSMNRSDNLAEGDSLYLAETKRILHLVHLAESGQPVLLVIDEILSGTNSHERIRAGTEIIRYLSQGNFDCLVLTATHDLEIPAALAGQVASWHFTDQVGPAGLKFDYALRPGIVKERNAIKLLDHLGYPEGIMAQLRDPCGSIADSAADRGADGAKRHLERYL